MKTFFKLTALLLVTATFVASCSKGDDNGSSTTTPNTTDETTEVSFSASISAMPSKATDTTFESGDEISVSAYYENGTTYQSNVSYIYNAGLFTSTTPIAYMDEDLTFSFRAIYPYVEVDDDKTISFTIESDQSYGDNYTRSDLMFGYVGETNSVEYQTKTAQTVRLH